MAAVLPVDFATQNDWVAGGLGLAVPSRSVLSRLHGSTAKSFTLSIGAPARYLSTWAFGPTPTNTFLSVRTESAEIRTRGWPSTLVTSAVPLILATSDTSAEVPVDTSRWPELNVPSLPPMARMPPPPRERTVP